MTKPDKPPVTGATQRTPSALKRETKIYDHFKASGNKKGENLTEELTKTEERIPPAPVTNDKLKDPDDKGSPNITKDLQEQFNNIPPSTEPNPNPSTDTLAPTVTPDNPATYNAALTGQAIPTTEEDFLTQGGFTIHETDKRKRSTRTTPTKSPAPSLRSPDAKQSKLFQKGQTPTITQPHQNRPPPKPMDQATIIFLPQHLQLPKRRN